MLVMREVLEIGSIVGGFLFTFGVLAVRDLSGISSFVLWRRFFLVYFSGAVEEVIVELKSRPIAWLDFLSKHFLREFSIVIFPCNLITMLSGPQSSWKIYQIGRPNGLR